MELEGALDNLEEYMSGSHDDLDPLLRAFVVHYQFEAIHRLETAMGVSAGCCFRCRCFIG